MDRRRVTGIDRRSAARTSPRCRRASRTSGGSPTSPRTASGAGCCSTSTSPRTPSWGWTTGRPSRSARAAPGSTAQAIRRRAQKIVDAFDVRPPDLDLPARSLSGGNQQKLVLGRELELPPRLLLVAQPTRGVDIGGIEFIHRRLVELRDSGCAILLVSSELEEVMALSDRLLVMRQGRIVAEVDPARTSAEEIGLLMTGGEAAA